MSELQRLISEVSQSSVQRTTRNEAFEQLVRQLLRDSLAAGASHLHLHCSATDLLVRYRVLGKLQQRATLPSEAWDGLLRELKLTSGMDTSEPRRPQIGTGSFKEGERPRPYLVSVVRARHGPSAVVTWQQPDDRVHELHELGLLPGQQQILQAMLAQRRGMLVVSGSAWMGKRTLGQALLLGATAAGRRALSLEWSVNRSLPGIVQDLADVPREGQLRWLESALRQLPDVVYVESPDHQQETLARVIMAAKNECLVVAAMSRPLEYLVEWLEYQRVTPAESTRILLGCVECRRAPAVCGDCGRPYTPRESELHALKIRCGDPSRLSFARADGCLKCDRSGRQGWIGAYEVSAMRPELRERFLRHASPQRIRRCLLDNGMTTFYQAAVHHVVTRRIASTTAISHFQGACASRMCGSKSTRKRVFFDCSINADFPSTRFSNAEVPQNDVASTQRDEQAVVRTRCLSTE